MLLKNDLIPIRLIRDVKADISEVVLLVQPVPVELANVLHGFVPVHDAVELRVDYEDDRSALNVVMAEPFVD